MTPSTSTSPGCKPPQAAASTHVTERCGYDVETAPPLRSSSGAGAEWNWVQKGCRTCASHTIPGLLSHLIPVSIIFPGPMAIATCPTCPIPDRPGVVYSPRHGACQASRRLLRLIVSGLIELRSFMLLYHLSFSSPVSRLEAALLCL